MDTKKSPMYKLPIHEHPLFPSAMFIKRKCAGCQIVGVMYGGYFCNEAHCNCWFHKDCAESPLEINHHPFHREHPLFLTGWSPTDDRIPRCDFCGQAILSTYYTCPICKFKVGLICGTKPSPPLIEHPVCHDHTLVFTKKGMQRAWVRCEVCKYYIHGRPSYSCSECNNVYFHLDCVHLSKEVYHSSHSSHPLKIMPPESLIDDDDDDDDDDDYDERNLSRWGVRGGDLHTTETDDDDDDDDVINESCCFCLDKRNNVRYQCLICNFTLCLKCTKRPPPLVVDDTKTHSHPLTLFPNKIAFICKVSGLLSNGYMSYICLKCAFVVSGPCVGIPHIININRHDHRISFRPHLGHKGAKCGVCRERVNQYYGAYSCAICPNYVVHSICAVDFNLWNGVELEGIPETSEDIVPFKVMGDNLIRHFFHDKHILLYLKDYDDMVGDERVRCEACVSPIGFGPIYSCKECRFFLHEKCAYLPLKKNLVFNTTPYKLEYQGIAKYCNLCGIFSGGFKYRSKGRSWEYPIVDVHCSSISEPFDHNAHFHPLYFVKPKKKCYCNACGRVPEGVVGVYMLNCDACDFDLCLYCATLPEKIWHISDEHPLTLYYGEKEMIGENWCEVCEMELDPSKWFFTCSDCGVTLHVGCVLGDFSRLTPNCSIPLEGKEYLVILNYQNSRPFCTYCHDRCKAPVILQVNDQHNVYICSLLCLMSSSGVKVSEEILW